MPLIKLGINFLPLIKWIVNSDFFLALFYQDGDLLVPLVLKRTLEVVRFVWVLDFVNLLSVCYNRFVPVFSTSSISLCGCINFLHFEILPSLSR